MGNMLEIIHISEVSIIKKYDEVKALGTLEVWTS